MEKEERITMKRIGINVRKHKELIHHLYELTDASGIGPDITPSRLIDTIADEPPFTKIECVGLGLYLASINNVDEHTEREKSHEMEAIRPFCSRSI